MAACSWDVLESGSDYDRRSSFAAPRNLSRTVAYLRARIQPLAMVLSLVAAATATAAQPHEGAVLLECPYDLTSLAYSPDGSMVVAAASSSPAMRQQNAAKQGDGIVVFTGDGAGWRKVLTAAPTQHVSAKELDQRLTTHTTAIPPFLTVPPEAKGVL